MKKIKWCNLYLLMYPSEHSVFEDRSRIDPLRRLAKWRDPNEENVTCRISLSGDRTEFTLHVTGPFFLEFQLSDWSKNQFLCNI